MPPLNPPHRFHGPFAVVVPPIIEPERFFVEIPEKVERLITDVCTLEAPLEQAPKIFQSVRVDVPPHISLRMVNGLMDIIAFQSVI